MLSKIEGVEVFCPRISQIKKTRAGKKRFVEALFPSYLFAKFSFDQQYRQIIHTQGVSHLVQNGDRRAVPEAIITQLRDSVPEGIIEAADPSIEPGAKIQFMSGSLKGFSGEVLAQLPASDRIEVLLDILGQEITVAVSANDIILSDDG